MTDKQREWLRCRHKDAQKAYDALMKYYPFMTDDLGGEQWADIAGYEGLYQESTFGRTKSFKRGSVKILKPMLSARGYLSVDLCKNGKTKRFLVHRLVAEAFIPNLDDKPEVNHVNGCKFNCHVSNLEWATSAENTRHAVAIGLKKSGEENYLAGVTNEQAEQIRNLYVPYDKNFGGKALAKLFGLTPQAICHIVHGKHYRNANGQIHETRQKKSTCLTAKFNTL